MIHHDPLLVTSYLEHALRSLKEAGHQWRFAADEATMIGTEHFEALEEDLARTIGDVERLCRTSIPHLHIIRDVMIRRERERQNILERK